MVTTVPNYESRLLLWPGGYQTLIIPWSDVRSLVSCRLIALDKCPGIRPIGIGETLRRIIGKAICFVTGPDIKDVCGVDQLCAGVHASFEGAVHAINDLFQEHCSDDWGVLMVDASNAFNSINRLAVLWNAHCCGLDVPVSSLTPTDDGLH